MSSLSELAEFGASGAWSDFFSSAMLVPKREPTVAEDQGTYSGRARGEEGKIVRCVCEGEPRTRAVMSRDASATSRVADEASASDSEAPSLCYVTLAISAG